MAKIKTKKQFYKKMGTKNLNKIAKSKIKELSSILPNLDPEVAKEVIAQFPGFVDLSKNLVKEYREVVNKAMDEGSVGAKAYYKACEKILDNLEKELARENLSQSERNEILDKMIKVSKDIEAKHEKDQNFLLKIIKAFAYPIMFIVIFAFVAIGGKISLPEAIQVAKDKLK